MGSKRSRLRLLACGLLLLPFVAASGSPAAADGTPQRCTSGASSIRAYVVDGRVVTTKPATSGCIPASR